MQGLEMTEMPLVRDLRELIAEGDPLDKTYILIDPIVGEPLPDLSLADQNADPQATREGYWQRQIERIALPHPISLSLHQHPYLVLTHGVDDPLLQLTNQLANKEWLCANAHGLDGSGSAAHRIGGWLKSRATPERLAAELARIFRVNTARFTRAKYFRVADRRVLGLLRHVVGDTNVMKQFDCVSRWIYLDIQGSLAQLVRKDEELQRLRLTCAEWDRMQRSEEINRTSAQWLGELARTESAAGLGKHTSQLYGSLEQAVDQAVGASRKYPQRFTSISDHTAFAALSLLHPGFERHPAAIAVLEQQSEPEPSAEPMRFMVPQLIKALNEANFRSYVIN
jgi:hypothetical protein